MANFSAKPAGLCGSVLSFLFDGYWPPAEPGEPAPIRVHGAQLAYTLNGLLAVGDVADIHLATTEAEPLDGAAAQYLVKISRIPAGRAMLEREQRTLCRLLKTAAGTTYGKYLPALVESFPARDKFPKHVNVFRAEPGLRTLEQVHAQLPALDGRHLGWIGNRLLTVLGFCQRQGIVHGAVLPCHVLLQPGNHGLQLVGWGQSVAVGQRLRTITTRYRDWYPDEVLSKQAALPATDLFLAARCLVYLAGGDPARNWLPATVPQVMQRFLQSCLLAGARMRPDDAWALQEEFQTMLQHLYGPPQFHELHLT